ncbi:hypothetical protein B0T16DRAFT_218645 [Cercophora newfieldiana]|uniref:Glycosyltransferase 2 n=1 Tax=Cercophora newfieldiana TaxID=92897 RepID=A0AA39XWN7_9PEZI|nr:hypothetical protein B0T16DRAFT_218645 [Cercophora newfieldiana]
MGSLFLSDEELVKKDDDHKPTKGSAIRGPFGLARVPPRKLLKRIAIVLAAGALIYLFIHNIPTDVPIRDRRRPNYVGDHVDAPAKPMPKLKPKPLQPPNWNKPLKPPKKGNAPPKGPGGGLAPASKPYDGPIRFEKLADSLQAISGTRGDYVDNKNVLFAASSLKSAALLLPVACKMGAELRSYVHFAVMSKSEIPVDQLREVNGVDDSCQLIFHDARPDRAGTSSEDRFLKAVMRGFYHINSYMHPQVVIVDASDSESGLFLEAARVQLRSMKIPIIELPENSPSKLTWLTKLDSASLAAWHKVNIEILIQAAPGTSGNLVRLLKSLVAADFSASATPHLTIELPNNVDAATAAYLETFQWPPAKAYNPTHVKQLTLRHRIPRNSLTEEESSARFLESFWPADPRHSHVLVLSPQVELSPSFFHCKLPPLSSHHHTDQDSTDIKYSVLEYMHSNAAITQQWDSRLLAISLDLPSTHLDATKSFAPPSNKDASSDAISSPFLWQAPNSNAVLYTGQKWVELHAFVSHLLEFQQTAEKNQTPLPSVFTNKLVSKRYPSWLEHALKLSRARGYWTLYPSQLTAGNLAVVHNEMYRAPEEYEKEIKRGGLADSAEIVLAGGSLLENLPFGGTLPGFDQMPLLLWDGRATKLRDLDAHAVEYAGEFRKAVGGCEGLTPSELLPRQSARDLFCEREG